MSLQVVQSPRAAGSLMTGLTLRHLIYTAAIGILTNSRVLQYGNLFQAPQQQPKSATRLRTRAFVNSLLDDLERQERDSVGGCTEQEGGGFHEKHRAPKANGPGMKDWLSGFCHLSQRVQVPNV